MEAREGGDYSNPSEVTVANWSSCQMPFQWISESPIPVGLREKGRPERH